MTLQAPFLNQLKTELVAILDYIQPSLPPEDPLSFIEADSSVQNQSNEVRSALSANMFVDLLSKIGNIKPSEIELSARFIREVIRIIESYEVAIAPMENLVIGNNSILFAVRTQISELTSLEFPRLDPVPTNISIVPNSIIEAILSPFYPLARMKFFSRDYEKTNIILNAIYGPVSRLSPISKPNFLIIPNGMTVGSGPYASLKEMSMAMPFQFVCFSLDYLAQYKAISSLYPQWINNSESAHSYIIKNAFNDNDLGIINNLLFDYTTSNAQMAMPLTLGENNPSTKINTIVMTDEGYVKAIENAFGRNSLMAGNKIGILDYINKPENILRQDIVSTLRDGFILDTPVALENGIPGATTSPINSEKYKSFTNTVLQERNDIISKMEEIICDPSSPIILGSNADYLPGVSDPLLIERGIGFKGTRFLAIKFALGRILRSDEVVKLVNFVLLNKNSYKERFYGVKLILGNQWIDDAITNIAQHFINGKLENLQINSDFLNNINEDKRNQIENIKIQISNLEAEIERYEEIVLTRARTIQQRNIPDPYNGLGTQNNTGIQTFSISIEYATNLALQELGAVQRIMEELEAQISGLREQILQIWTDDYGMEEIIISLYKDIPILFPFLDCFMVNENNLPQSLSIRAGTNFSSLLNSTSFIGLGPNFILPINEASSIDINFREQIESGEILPNEMIDAVNDVLLRLIESGVNKANELSPNLSEKDFGNYLYTYLLLAGLLCEKVFVGATTSQVQKQLFKNINSKTIGINLGVTCFLPNKDERIKFGQSYVRYLTDIGNSIGLGQSYTMQALIDPYQSSLSYVQSISNLLVNTIPASFSIASEALSRASKALRKSFAQNIVISSGNIQIPINMIDYLLTTQDFRAFSIKCKDFNEKKTLTPVLLLASDNLAESVNILQFCLYVLTESPLTKLTNIKIGDYTIPFNKNAVVGIHKDLERLLGRLPEGDATYTEIKKGRGSIKVFERQFDPSPSFIDQINADQPLFQGTRFLQAIESTGQKRDGYKFYINSKLDYEDIKNNFRSLNPVITYFYRTQNIYGRTIESFINIDLRGLSFNASLVNEELEYAINFIRSEALKIYYYYMTGFIFEPEFLPDPMKDDSLLTQNLLSANPVTRLRSIIDIYASTDLSYFSNILFIPFVSDNDSIEEFSSIISLGA
jgi:hypothetical protein